MSKKSGDVYFPQPKQKRGEKKSHAPSLGLAVDPNLEAHQLVLLGWGPVNLQKRHQV